MLVILNDQQRRVKATTTTGCQPNTTKGAPRLALSPSYIVNLVLNHLIAEESDFVSIFGAFADALNRFEDVTEAIGDMQLLAGHTGMASAMT